MEFTNQFGTFTEGEHVIYSVYPYPNNISGLAYEDRIDTTDPVFLAQCDEEQMAKYCLWENAHSVRKLTQ